MNRIPNELLGRLTRRGATVTARREIDHATQYTLMEGSHSATLNVYSSGKTSEGGKETPLKETLREYRLSRASPGKGKARVKGDLAGETRSERAENGFTVPNATPRVGTDEAGKGEYFGPLVVAGVRALGGEPDAALRRLGVRDSKTLGLRGVRDLAAGIAAEIGDENFLIVSLSPEEYAARREAAGRNVNRLLGELNVQIIGELKGKIEVAVVDQFGVKAREYVEAGGIPGVRIEARPRAEDDAAVAAASILARARYLEGLDLLSESVGFELPRGSTHVLDAGRRVYRKFGETGLGRVAKVHFATTQRIIETPQ